MYRCICTGCLPLHAHTHTDPLTHSLACSLTHARKHAPTDSLAQPPTPPPTHPPTHSLTSPHLTRHLTSPHLPPHLTSPADSLTHSFTHSLTHSLTHPPTHARTHALTHSHWLLPLNMGMLGYVNFTGCTEINGLSTTLTGCLISQLAGCLPSKSQPNAYTKKGTEMGWSGWQWFPASQKKRVTQLTWMACLVVSGFTQWTPRVAVWPSWSTLSCKSSHSWPVALLGVNQARVIKRTPSYKKVCCNMIWMKDRWCKASIRCRLIKTWELVASQHDPTLGPHISRLRPWRHITPATKPALDGPPKFNIQWPEVGHLQHQTNHSSLVGPRPLDGRGVLLGWGGVGHVFTLTWTCTWSRCYAVAATWGMYSRSCELAHEVGATLWLSVGPCIHVHVNLHMK